MKSPKPIRHKNLKWVCPDMLKPYTVKKITWMNVITFYLVLKTMKGYV